MTSPLETIKLSEKIEVSVVIPHFYPTRKKNLEALIEDFRKQSFKDMEIIIVRGVSPQGKAINEGARATQGEVLVVMDDDSRLGHSRVIENLVEVLKQDSSIAMAGASIISPEEANEFQKKAAQQFPDFKCRLSKKLRKAICPVTVAWPSGKMPS